MGPKRLSSILAVLLLVAGGCATVPERRPVEDAAARALAVLVERWQALRDLTALADIALERDGERYRFAGVLLVQQPASVRFEALSPFGQPYLLVAIHNGRITAYDAAKNEALVGPANADTIGRVLGLPLEADDLVAVLTARVAPPKDLRVAELLPPDDAGPSLRLITPAQRQRVWLDPATGVVSQVELEGGPVSMRIAYRRDGATPAGFDFDAANASVTGSVRYRSARMDTGVDPGRFELVVPKGAKTKGIR